MKRKPQIALFIVTTLLTTATLFGTVGRHHLAHHQGKDCKNEKMNHHFFQNSCTNENSDNQTNQ